MEPVFLTAADLGRVLEEKERRVARGMDMVWMEGREGSLSFSCLLSEEVFWPA